MMIKLFLLALVLVGFAVAAIAIKMFVKKGGEFKKQCSTIDPETGQSHGCTCGTRNAGDCDNR